MVGFGYLIGNNGRTEKLFNRDERDTGDKIIKKDSKFR
jgi:hypothetical protein